MTRQNRVLPTGEIVAAPFRGTFTGNRGILHRDDGTLGVSRWSHPHWIICTLTHPKGRYHGPAPARGWTALFFSDEAVALAAGHRPCGYCRRAAYGAWTRAWAEGFGAWPGHKAADALLHRARVLRNRKQIRHVLDTINLPDGAFILWENRPHLHLSGKIFPYEKGVYGTPRPMPRGKVTVLTPAPTLTVLRAGYRPKVLSSLLA